ncbi:MAG: ATP12 family protein [Pseudomonadota bacterium]
MTRLGETPPRLPKRFYKAASAESDGGAFHIRLDGKTAKTRGGKPLCAVTKSLGEAVAREWNAQGEHIAFARMPMTRYAMTVCDLGGRDLDIWREAVLAFLKSDLCCYRANEPAELVARQSEAWNPLLAWAGSELNVRLSTGAGVGFIEQPHDAYAAARAVLAAATTEQVLGVKEATEISGSAVIGLALLKGAFPADQLFAASRVDEEFQSDRWGADAEASAREVTLRRDFLDAARFLSLV